MSTISQAANTVNEGLMNCKHWEKLTTVNSNWHRDALFRNYHKLGNKQKGVLGEYYVEKLMEAKGSEVCAPTNSDHDRIIDGFRTEIKFSLAVSKKDTVIYDKFMINHVAASKQWDRLIFVGINPKRGFTKIQESRNGIPLRRVRAYFMEKGDFVNYMTGPGKKVFKHQQSGEKGQNDDFICTDFAGFVSLPFVKEVAQW
tara:strand:+ start:1733 stop:2332 length:600 start_codon:yes stop_codon:yes gene_type:complete